MDNAQRCMTAADALVIFGVTGDLASKMIFPALYAMARRGTLNVPVVGVAWMFIVATFETIGQGMHPFPRRSGKPCQP